MNLRLKYRESDYFNEEDTYVFYHLGTERYLVSKAHKHNGNWFANEGLQYKCTSVPCFKFSEIKNKEITLSNFVGRIIQPLEKHNCLGIIWNQGQKGIPNYWWDINKIKSIEVV